jgi:hypothetical protein
VGMSRVEQKDKNHWIAEWYLSSVEGAQALRRVVCIFVASWIGRGECVVISLCRKEVVEVCMKASRSISTSVQSIGEVGVML